MKANRLLYRIQILIVAINLSLTAFSQSDSILGIQPFDLDLYPELQRFELRNGNKPSDYQSPLLKKMDDGSLSSYEFVSTVGGVSFAQTAVFTKAVTNIKMEYLPLNQDGNRLKLTINDRDYLPLLYDWQLIPISRYANSDYHACVSLFGPAATNEAHHIVYHPAFLNTLLGLRLLQADILLMNIQVLWNVFYNDNHVILGAGEQTPDPFAWKAYAIDLSEIMTASKFRSWILTDAHEKVVVSLDDGLYIEGSPYYFFWDADMDKYTAEYKKLSAEIDQAWEKKEPDNYNKLVDLINKLEPKVIPVDKLTEKLKSNNHLLQGLNKPVYSATKNTMQYAALFRYIRQYFPETWENYSAVINLLKAPERVETPVVMLKSQHD